MNSNTIIKSIEAVTRKWTRQRKQEERGHARSRREALTNCRGPSIKYAAWCVMEEAYLKASDEGKLPASARQIYYAARNQIMEMTGKSALDSQYFTQTILPAYIAEHPDETAEWDVTYDARGHFTEPHTEVIAPLGTLDVRSYLEDVKNHLIEPLDASDFLADRICRFPSCGPVNRFSAVLFIEKEGFMPLFRATKLAERYDIAIMSTKGMPVVACRHLADELCGKYGIPLLVLRDFDKAGFSIFATLDGRSSLDEETTRYEYRYDFKVIDLGLRLSDVRKYGLESETVRYRSDPSWNLASNGATQEEIEFLCGDWGHRGKRVELNAFTSGDFIDWIEAKLKANGIEKVIPSADVLETAYRRAMQAEMVREQLDAVVKNACQQAEWAKSPEDLDRIVRKAIKDNPHQPWDQVVATTATANCKNRDGRKAAIQQAESPARTDAILTTAPPPADSRLGNRHQ